MKLLIIRFSALGDVAMLVPVIRELALQYPEVQITVLSQPFLHSLFEGMAENVTFIGADIKKEYRGMSGLSRLYSLLKKEHFNAVADMHDVLRSKYLRLRFSLSNKLRFASHSQVKIAHIDKHRAGKRALTREQNKILVQQPTSFDNYREVLTKLGLPTNVQNNKAITKATSTQYLSQAAVPIPPQAASHKQPQTTPSIGVAPFAAHKGKIYPLEKMQQVVSLLIDRGHHIYLFGAGRQELETLHSWQQDFGKEHITVVADIIHKNLKAEIELMGKLEAMLTMDSGNQHLAALSGTRVVSIWGATHPYAGFLAYGQSPEDVVQRELPCRPCSIYGNKPCRYGGYHCLSAIPPKEIVEKLCKKP